MLPNHKRVIARKTHDGSLILAILNLLPNGYLFCPLINIPSSIILLNYLHKSLFADSGTDALCSLRHKHQTECILAFLSSVPPIPVTMNRLKSCFPE